MKKYNNSTTSTLKVLIFIVLWAGYVQKKKQMIQFSHSQYIINSPLEQFEVNSLLGVNAPILGYVNLSLTNYLFFVIVDPQSGPCNCLLVPGTTGPHLGS